MRTRRGRVRCWTVATPLLTVALLSAWPATPAWALVYFKGIGPTFYGATSVSPDGAYVGIARYGHTGYRRHSVSGISVDVGLESQPNGMSTDGGVVAGTRVRTGSDDKAFRWTQATGRIFLPPPVPEPPAPFSEAWDVTADGTLVVGGTKTTTGTSALQWTQAGGTVPLGDLPGGGEYSIARGVSADGTVIVGHGLTATRYEAFRRTSVGGLVGLGGIGGNVFDSWANGVSADGAVIVGGGNLSDVVNPDREAFRWTAAGGMVGLGDLLGGGQDSEARATSGDGSVVVGVASGMRAFIWDAGNGMRNLQTVLTTNYGVDLTGWQLREATAISDDGTVIAGSGRFNGLPGAWFVDLDWVPMRVSGAFTAIRYNPLGFRTMPTDGLRPTDVGLDLTAVLEDFTLSRDQQFATIIWYYDPDEVAMKRVVEGSLRLHWSDNELWYAGGTTPEGGFGRGFDMGDTTRDPSLFGMGTFGINSAENYVWANVAHASTYAIVGALVPEPCTTGLLALMGLGLWRRRRHAR